MINNGGILINLNGDEKRISRDELVIDEISKEEDPLKELIGNYGCSYYIFF